MPLHTHSTRTTGKESIEVTMDVYSSVQLVISVIYLTFVISIISIKLIKPLNDLLLYGKTSTTSTRSSSSSQIPSVIKQIIQYVSTNLTVPKSWFTHFYITLFTLTTLIYLQQLTYNHQLNDTSNNQITYKNMIIIEKLLWIQGLRRLIECLTITNFSPTARMNIAHYLIGMAHYILVSLGCYLGLQTSYSTVKASLTITDCVLITLFAISSVQQFLNHYHLSTLVKYSVPQFKLVSSPHYLNEIQIYLVLFLFSIKNGWNLTSLTFFSCLAFVIVNLSISSIETHKFYQQKFREEFKQKWSIFPGLL